MQSKINNINLADENILTKNRLDVDLKKTIIIINRTVLLQDISEQKN